MVLSISGCLLFLLALVHGLLDLLYQLLRHDDRQGISRQYGVFPAVDEGTGSNLAGHVCEVCFHTGRRGQGHAQHPARTVCTDDANLTVVVLAHDLSTPRAWLGSNGKTVAAHALLDFLHRFCPLAWLTWGGKGYGSNSAYLGHYVQHSRALFAHFHLYLGFLWQWDAQGPQI